MFARVRAVYRCFASSAAAEFDLIVIGAGSGGLACSKTAASLGAKVALVDAVAPSPHGTKWGIGGTCANVGCIPKKLMHQAALVGKELENASSYGWNRVQQGHDWQTLVRVVNDRIKANNWIYRVDLNEKGVKYFNAFASFVDSTTVRATADGRKKTETLLRAPRIVVATGLRPRYPQIPGRELGITSDDVFTLKELPGRTLVVGGSYVALETAGFLKGLGFSVDLLIRSRPLKGFDQDCVRLVMKSLSEHGVNILPPIEVQRIEKHGEAQKLVTLGDDSREVYDTVVWAIGREPSHGGLALDKAEVETASSGRILVNEEDMSTKKNIFAVGDIADGRPELTPTAILSGQLLASRLFGKSTKLMNYLNVATTVFTPLELGTVGMTEEDAVDEYGEAAIEVYHSYFTPFEYVVPQHQDSENCYAKLCLGISWRNPATKVVPPSTRNVTVVCRRDDPRRVRGMHVVGPNAAEIIQGYAVALRAGMTFDQLTETVAIHPCSSEEFIKMSVSKRSGANPRGRGCCG